MNFKVFLLIFALPIFFDIFDISVKSKYRYICNYRYFVPCSQEEDDGILEVSKLIALT